MKPNKKSQITIPNIEGGGILVNGIVELKVPQKEGRKLQDSLFLHCFPNVLCCVCEVDS